MEALCLNCRIRPPEPDGDPLMAEWIRTMHRGECTRHCQRCSANLRRHSHVHQVRSQGVSYPVAQDLWPIVDPDTDTITGYYCAAVTCTYTEEL